MSYWDEISARLAALTGVATPKVARAALGEFDVRDIEAVRVSEGGGGGSQSVKSVFCAPVAAADLLAGPIALYTPAAGESVVGLFVGSASLAASAGLIVAADAPLGTPNEPIGAVDASMVYDSAFYAATVAGHAQAAVTDPLLIGPTTSPTEVSNPAFSRPWQANTAYNTPDPLYSLIEAGHLWQNSGSAGTSGSSKPDFAGNVGGSVADGPDITWYDLEAFEDVALTAILLVAVDA